MRRWMLFEAAMKNVETAVLRTILIIGYSKIHQIQVDVSPHEDLEFLFRIVSILKHETCVWNRLV